MQPLRLKPPWFFIAPVTVVSMVFQSCALCMMKNKFHARHSVKQYLRVCLLNTLSKIYLLLRIKYEAYGVRTTYVGPGENGVGPRRRQVGKCFAFSLVYTFCFILSYSFKGYAIYTGPRGYSFTNPCSILCRCYIKSVMTSQNRFRLTFHVTVDGFRIC